MNGSETEAPEPGGARILIVDDTPGNLALLVDALQAAGHRPFVATSGEAALARLGQSQPALILLDMRMPGMDGLETCARIQADARWRDIPVIFMTAVEEPEQKVAAFAAGAVDYVTKPFHPDEVLARIRAHLRIKALQQRLADELAWRAETERALEASLEQAVVVAAPDGRVQFCTQRAGYLLRAFFPPAEAGRLPFALIESLRTASGTASTVEGASGVLHVRFVQDAAPEDPVLIMLEERRREGDYAPLRELGLSGREAEVLYWISQGKSNPETAIIVGAASATVRKHAENIYAKLGVEGRGAATLRALEALRGR
jgi:DNA-binding response OmpR family regulator/DNA-binding CsgD family transcriptional regulator